MPDPTPTFSFHRARTATSVDAWYEIKRLTRRCAGRAGGAVETMDDDDDVDLDSALLGMRRTVSDGGSGGVEGWAERWSERRPGEGASDGWRSEAGHGLLEEEEESQEVGEASAIDDEHGDGDGGFFALMTALHDSGDGGCGRQLALLIAFALLHNFKPSEPFLVELYDAHGIPSREVFTRLFPVWTYARLPSLAAGEDRPS